MRFYPLSSLQQSLNRRFYRHRSRIHTSFATFAPCPLLQKARAKEFFQTVASHRNSVCIADVGIGEGHHTFLFLKALRKCGYKGSLTLHLYDIAPPLLKKAKSRVERFCTSLLTFQRDLSLSSDPFVGTYDLITFHEMLDDLPSSLFVRHGKTTYEVLLSSNLTRHRLSPTGKRAPTIPSFLEKYFIPLNERAYALLHTAHAHLSPDGYIEVTDYGFLYPRKKEQQYASGFLRVRDMPHDAWNETVVRSINGHITTDINFSALCASLDKRRIPYRLLLQKEFVQQRIGTMVDFVEGNHTLRYRIRKEKSPSSTTDDLYGYLQIFSKKC